MKPNLQFPVLAHVDHDALLHAVISSASWHAAGSKVRFRGPCMQRSTAQKVESGCGMYPPERLLIAFRRSIAAILLRSSAHSGRGPNVQRLVRAQKRTVSSHPPEADITGSEAP